MAVVGRRAITRRSHLEVQGGSRGLVEESHVQSHAGDSSRVESIPTINTTVSSDLTTPPTQNVIYASPAELIVTEAEDDVSISPLPKFRDEVVQNLTPGPTSDRRLTNEAAAALQFLAHGRRNVLNRFAGRESVVRPTPYPIFGERSSEYGAPWDIFFSIDDVRVLLALHEEHLVWMHNAVHLPTFRQEFEGNVLEDDCDKSWVALYYAMLSHTLFHVDGTQLLTLMHSMASTANIDISRLLFDKSIDNLFRGGFMSEHKLTSVQAICLLLQVAHNFDKSDLICILISTAIRISQCLNLHRLGTDRGPTLPNIPDPNARAQEVIDRETEKRVWWFLVRYDWFQIPFQNTCQVHPAQFNTPIPGETFNEPDRMVQNGILVLQPQESRTPGRWASVLNQVSVIIWKHQDRMQKVGYPADDKSNMLKLYDQVIWADREIKSLYATWPRYMREARDSTWETAVGESLVDRLMPSLVLLSIAHKILIVHRHFQLTSFRDRRFAFTQLSCVTISEQAMEAVQCWPDVAEVHIVRRMWTTLTFVISCSTALVFVLLFKSENSLTFDLGRIRRLVEFSRDFIKQEEQTSSIARRGVRLLDALMDLERRSEDMVDIEADIGDIVRNVAVADGSCMDPNAAEAHEIVFPFGQDSWSSFMGNYTNEDFLGMNLS